MGERNKTQKYSFREQDKVFCLVYSHLFRHYSDYYEEIILIFFIFSSIFLVFQFDAV